jgi:chromosomal replication initiation ATPase DnaA
VARFVLDLAVSQAFSVRSADLSRPTRGRARIAVARQAGMYLAHVVLGLTMDEVGRLFSRDRTTVAHACSVIEDRRDDPTFDRSLDMLEWAVLAMLRREGDATA